MSHVYLKLTQAQHNQLKHAMAKHITALNQSAEWYKADAKLAKAVGESKEDVKVLYSWSRRETQRSNRLGTLQKIIKNASTNAGTVLNYE